ncbi:MAG: phage holin family protein [Armatimonadota bacterium]|nr:phage holin family protein [Armatimonadota bacterium]MDR7563025.1 phage holin family protein [Armatimonadota bacterium]MDR7567676.1 phage holin family protein [Armatimonadota bacterium]MDR7600869.1 phage holin family protein [Armatimonadota bacterium]
MTYRFQDEARALLRDLAQLAGQHLALVRSELQTVLRRAVSGLALLVVAGALLVGAVLFAPVVLTLILALWLPLWAAALIMFLLAVLGVAGIAWLAIRRLRMAKFTESCAVLREDLQWIRDLLSTLRESGPSAR